MGDDVPHLQPETSASGLHPVRDAVLIGAAGLVVAGLVLLGFHQALPDMVQSTRSGAPRGMLQSKDAALGYLVVLVPALTVFVIGMTIAATALGPDYLNTVRPEAKEFWSRPGNWRVARAFLLRRVAVFVVGLDLLIVVVTGLDAGSLVWHLGAGCWVASGVALVLLLGWLVWQTMRLEHPERLVS